MSAYSQKRTCEPLRITSFWAHNEDMSTWAARLALKPAIFIVALVMTGPSLSHVILQGRAMKSRRRKPPKQAIGSGTCQAITLFAQITDLGTLDTPPYGDFSAHTDLNTQRHQ